jgi:hypothetical protein
VALRAARRLRLARVDHHQGPSRLVDEAFQRLGGVVPAVGDLGIRSHHEEEVGVLGVGVEERGG